MESEVSFKMVFGCVMLLTAFDGQVQPVTRVLTKTYTCINLVVRPPTAVFIYDFKNIS